MRRRLQLGAEVGAAQIAVASVVGLGFAIYLTVMIALAPPSEAQWAAADPILHIAPRGVSLWLVPLLALVAALFWCWRGRPDRAALVAGAGQVVVGVLLAAAMTLTLRLVAGPSLPSFIPAEESAAPGFTLSMTAGYGEELLFRLALVPAIYLPLVARVRRPLAVAIAALVSGLAFALLHEVAGDPSSVGYFVTRTLVPGAGMTVVYLVVAPSTLIAAHGSAHLLIPLLFQ